jgi:hypothetical protein
MEIRSFAVVAESHLCEFAAKRVGFRRIGGLLESAREFEEGYRRERGHGSRCRAMAIDSLNVRDFRNTPIPHRVPARLTN